MKPGTSLKPALMLGLDALNGLLVGLAVETARVAYLNYQMSQAAREYAKTQFFVDFTTARWEPVPLMLGMLVFPAIGYLVRQFFTDRAQLLLLVWFALGAIALGLGYFMATTNANLFSVLWWCGLGAMIYSVHRQWKLHTNSLPLLCAVNGISTLIIVAVGIQAVGLFFYWPELRSPFTWVLFLVVIVATSVTCGTMVQFIGTRFLWREGQSRN
jgi:hypothetical protein